jgi:hypothetical protein
MVLLDILLLPGRLFIDVFEKIKDMADEEMLVTIGSIKRKFQETQAAYDQGEINEAEYNEILNFLSNRLTQLQERIEEGE